MMIRTKIGTVGAREGTMVGPKLTMVILGAILMIAAFPAEMMSLTITVSGVSLTTDTKAIT